MPALALASGSVGIPLLIQAARESLMTPASILYRNCLEFENGHKKADK